jgi:hypothetical protein
VEFLSNDYKILDAVNNEEKKVQNKVNAKVKGQPTTTEKDCRLELKVIST